VDPPYIIVVVLCYTIRGKLPLDQFVILSFRRGVNRGRVWILGSTGLCTPTLSPSRALWRRCGPASGREDGTDAVDLVTGGMIWPSDTPSVDQILTVDRKACS
jgi:hypothetical protein